MRKCIHMFCSIVLKLAFINTMQCKIVLNIACLPTTGYEIYIHDRHDRHSRERTGQLCGLQQPQLRAPTRTLSGTLSQPRSQHQ